MKKQITLAIALLAMALTPVLSQEWGQPKPQISVSGSAEVKVVPDEIFLNVGIETRDKELQEAKKQNDDRVSGTLEFLKHNDVKEKDVKTDYISIQPVYLRDSEVYGVDPSTGFPVANIDKPLLPTKPLYYIVRKSIGIKLTNIGSFDAVMSGLITNGVNIVQGVDFRTSELRKYRDKARAMAVKAAKEKAVAMAAELGVKVGKPLSINANDSGGWSSWSRNSWGQGGGGGGGAYQNSSQSAGSASASEEGTLSVGQISVSANVNVSFLIE